MEAQRTERRRLIIQPVNEHTTAAVDAGTTATATAITTATKEIIKTLTATMEGQPTDGDSLETARAAREHANRKWRVAKLKDTEPKKADERAKAATREAKKATAEKKTADKEAKQARKLGPNAAAGPSKRQKMAPIAGAGQMTLGSSASGSQPKVSAKEQRELGAAVMIVNAIPIGESHAQPKAKAEPKRKSKAAPKPKVEPKAKTKAKATAKAKGVKRKVMAAKDHMALLSAQTRLRRQIATGLSSTRPRRQAGSQGRSQVRPSTPGKTFDFQLII